MEPVGRRRRSRLTVVVGALLLGVVLVAPVRAAPEVTLLYFGTETCPHCERMEDFLDDLEERHEELVVERHEVAEPDARQRWVEELAARGHQATGVPTAILDQQVWIGFDARVGAEIDAAVARHLAEVVGPPAPADDAPVGADPPTAPRDVVELPLLGEVDLTGRAPVAATALIAFVDGFNPCSLWVLTVLLAMVLHAGASRGRVAAVGGTFLLVTGLLYGAFIVGVFTLVGFVGHLDTIRVAVAVVALLVGAVNVKDFVAYKRGLSFTIPDRFKPRIYRGGRALRDRRRSLPAALGLTVVLAAGISLVELPCTAGFPVIWTGILHTQEVAGLTFGLLLALYLLIYVGVELVVFGVALVTLELGSFREAHGRTLKLVGGAVMIALGVVLLAAPQLMEHMLGASAVVLGAVAVALLLAAVERRRAAADDRARPRTGARR